MGFSEGAKTEAFNDDGEDASPQHGQNQGKVKGNPQHGESQSKKGPEHEDVPMGDVEHVKESQHQGESYGNQRVGAAQRHAIDQLLQEHPWLRIGIWMGRQNMPPHIELAKDYFSMGTQ